LSWRFFVRHYANSARQRADWKSRPDPATGEDSIFYPRTGALGGCTAHNAMILLAPHDSDWDEIARLTGDPSWRASKMRRYWRRLENCRHRPLWRYLLRWIGLDWTGHGWSGWLFTERATPQKAFDDEVLVKTLIETAWTLLDHAPRWWIAMRRILRGEADPNDQRRLRRRAGGSATRR